MSEIVFSLDSKSDLGFISCAFLIHPEIFCVIITAIKCLLVSIQNLIRCALDCGSSCIVLDTQVISRNPSSTRQFWSSWKGTSGLLSKEILWWLYHQNWWKLGEGNEPTKRYSVFIPSLTPEEIYKHLLKSRGLSTARVYHSDLKIQIYFSGIKGPKWIATLI